MLYGLYKVYKNHERARHEQEELRRKSSSVGGAASRGNSRSSTGLGLNDGEEEGKGKGGGCGDDDDKTRPLLDALRVQVHDEERGGAALRNQSALELEEKTFRIDFEFRDLGLKLKKNDKTILEGINGRIMSGRVTAVMGPSGAGKTSFVTTLSGKARSYGKVSGSIMLNGDPDLKLYDCK